MSKQLQLLNSEKKITVDADKYDFLSQFVWQLDENNEIYTLIHVLKDTNDVKAGTVIAELAKHFVYYFDEYNEKFNDGVFEPAINSILN